MQGDDFDAHARALIDQNTYLVLGTVDGRGRPWTAPVYFAAQHPREFFWMSSVDARHSRNLRTRVSVSLVVFDSTVAVGGARALYAAGNAAEVAPADLASALRVYPGPARRGGRRVTADDVSEPAPWRLYRAVVTDLWVLCPRELGLPCAAHSRTDDHRARVT
ncbi:pyridoxamine 5'-phosphate oxidase family protein [Amycolatopsis sp. SID8362]|uniref:pyridoxamine 5'-phosphate oxidase family protein n=1 Tax=Amycolatopsis sp. SID8362 TaxID=2690346 RepID=UPI00136A9873|nr:pyridoxamine 5'-phosphate oxidase family protein [Amycolatopsis sp. SID8362]NBH11004.1 pyridoxamine 5'-phosphate oxidase family protein [Amycolatopsis sp. SID8362]NED47695.1 pyridoxamine 5'-phosphate oxidase family protein [Amycolatopsis sp. SID8362]